MIHGIESNNWNIYCRPDVEAALVKWFLEHSEIRKYAIGDKARKGKKKGFNKEGYLWRWEKNSWVELLKIKLK